MEHRWELFEDDTLLGVLQPVALCVVLVVAVEHLGLNIVAERVDEVVHAFDVELDVVEVLEREDS